MRLSTAAILALGFYLSSIHPTLSSLLRRAPSLATVDASHVLSHPNVQLATTHDLHVRKVSKRVVAGNGEAKARAEEEEKKDEVDFEGTFDTPLALKGSDLRQDRAFQAVG